MQAKRPEPEWCKVFKNISRTLLVKILYFFTPYAWLTLLMCEVESFNSCLLHSQLHYRYDYVTNVKGKNTSPAQTVETERARLANYIQSDVRFSFWLIMSAHQLFIVMEACISVVQNKLCFFFAILFYLAYLQRSKQEFYAHWLLSALWHSTCSTSQSQQHHHQQCKNWPHHTL